VYSLSLHNPFLIRLYIAAPIISTSQKPNLQVPTPQHSISPNRSNALDTFTDAERQENERISNINFQEQLLTNEDSATESDNDEKAQASGKKAPDLHAVLNIASNEQPPLSRDNPTPRASQEPVVSESADLDASPIRPSKRSKAAPSSDYDSAEERKKRLVRLEGGAGVKRGTKQPIKRGGKKF